MDRATPAAMCAMIQRQREFGIRLALGADPRQVLSIAMRQGIVLVALGVTLGIAAAAAVTRYLAGMLVGVTPLDPRTYLAVAASFALIALLASYLPARRSTTTDPLTVLRQD